VTRDQAETTQPGLLTIEPKMSPEEALDRLRVNALAVHQRSMGRSDELVRILERTVQQLEKTHGRVKLMSTLLFVAGLLLVAAGAIAILAGNQDLWAVAIGGAGGLAAVAAVFWTAPLEKISNSVTDLVKLEAAFLGYIRVIGEIDSFFQMQYLDIIREPSAAGKQALTNTILNTTSQMKDIMTHAVELIDEHVSLPSESMSELRREFGAAAERLKRLETAAGATGT
jgi:hypothetical protein